MSGARIRLPNYDTLPEGVYFHQDNPGERRLIVQVPNVDRTDSETYVVDLSDTIHGSWVEGLKNSRNLLTVLGYARHVAYCPRTGYFSEMPDLDTPTAAAAQIATARREASNEKTSDRLVVRARRRRTFPASSLRMALSGRRSWGRV